MFKITAYEHVGIRVTDRSRAIRFYEKLGFREETDLPEHQAVEMVNDDGLYINLIYNGVARDGGRNILIDEAVKYPGCHAPRLRGRRPRRLSRHAEQGRHPDHRRAGRYRRPAARVFHPRSGRHGPGIRRVLQTTKLIRRAAFNAAQTRETLDHDQALRSRTVRVTATRCACWSPCWAWTAKSCRSIFWPASTRRRSSSA